MRILALRFIGKNFTLHSNPSLKNIQVFVAKYSSLYKKKPPAGSIRNWRQKAFGIPLHSAYAAYDPASVLR
jgi:hypothetical protein